MSIAGVGSYASIGGYYKYKTNNNIRQASDTFGESQCINLHMNDTDSENKALSSVGFPDGSSVSVFPGNDSSQYVVKRWDENGVEKEYIVDPRNVEAKDASYIEMLAYTTHLDITGRTQNAFGDFISAARGVSGNQFYGSGNVEDRYDFGKMVSEFMQSQYDSGNMAGYISVKQLNNVINGGTQRINYNGYNTDTHVKNDYINKDIYSRETMYETYEKAQNPVNEDSEISIQEKPLWHWHDGQFGFSAEVFKNEGSDSEYTVRLQYDDGRKVERVVDVNKIDGSNCNIVDLSVKMYHLEAEGKIENPAPQLIMAHIYMKYRTPDADENTNINFKGWFEQQLELEKNNGGNDNHIKELLKLIQNLSVQGGYEKAGIRNLRTSSTIDVSKFEEVTTSKYRIVPEKESGRVRIFVDGESAGVFKPEHLKIQEDAQTGTKVLIGETAGFNGAWYDAIPVNDELERALAEAMGVDEVPHKPLEGYYIGTHAETGIKYLMRPGDEGRSGRVLLCNAVDEARYKALGEEYARRYPNLIDSPEKGLIYADFEIRGMAHRGANGIVMTHPDSISYNDNDDPTKNWSVKIDEKTWSVLLSWFKNHPLKTDEMAGFKYWEGIFNGIGGKYERVWSDDELKQGFLYQ